ncbi:SDR family oxidoreductase [Chryseobacterium sp. MMS23-Vi53]|uniref:SDR family oxidoreductase n=1 Tax=Chryseobacterium sp. MMS23-Vi53 TaxID=3386644 RepID=UPI0039E791DC
MKEKVVVITGALGVLCRVLAVGLAEKGYKIALLARKMDEAEELASKITASGGTAFAFKADVLKKTTLEEARLQINEKLGSCDILINGAGGNHPSGTTSNSYLSEEDLSNDNENLTTFFDLDTKGIQYVFDLNFLGTLLPTQIFAKDMIGKQGCSVLNISSMSSFSPLTKIPAYSGAKAAVSNFTQWLAVHFSKAGIRVNAIAPGFFLTNQNRNLLLTESGDLTQRGHDIINQTPMKRFGQPEDLLGITLFLCDDASSFVTGVIIPVDGGFNAFSGV